MDRLAADPGLDAEPAARDQRPQNGGMFAPRTPNDARTSTGNGMPYFVPACALSSIGTRTIRFPSRIVPTACHQFIPPAIRPDASM